MVAHFCRLGLWCDLLLPSSDSRATKQNTKSIASLASLFVFSRLLPLTQPHPPPQLPTFHSPNDRIVCALAIDQELRPFLAGKVAVAAAVLGSRLPSPPSDDVRRRQRPNDVVSTTDRFLCDPINETFYIGWEQVPTK